MSSVLKKWKKCDFVELILFDEVSVEKGVLETNFFGSHKVNIEASADNKTKIPNRVRGDTKNTINRKSKTYLN